MRAKPLSARALRWEKVNPETTWLLGTSSRFTGKSYVPLDDPGDSHSAAGSDEKPPAVRSTSEASWPGAAALRVGVPVGVLLSSSAVASGPGGEVGDAFGSSVDRGVDATGVAGIISWQPDTSRMDRIKNIPNIFDLGSISSMDGVLADICLHGKK